VKYTRNIYYKKERRMPFKKGFSLIELLVVISIIALLLGILIPSIVIIKHRARGLVCQAGVKQMMMSWVLYASDNDDRMVGGNTINNDYPKYSWSYSWVIEPQDEAGQPIPDGVDFTFDDEIRGIESGYLYPYIENAELYHCKGAREGKYGGGYRSYSIAGLMNGEYSMPISMGGYPQFSVNKASRVKLPSTKLVIIEQTDTRGWNMGSWVLDISGIDWVDPIVIWHWDSTTMGFADGHAEVYKWVSKSTKILAEEQLWGINPDNYDGDRRDLEFAQNAFYPKK